ncbi:hypothetical protein Q2407_10415, partial [Escherichia coli]|nr:hypothetical protein [Escherichia coli]
MNPRVSRVDVFPPHPFRGISAGFFSPADNLS